MKRYFLNISAMQSNSTSFINSWINLCDEKRKKSFRQIHRKKPSEKLLKVEVLINFPLRFSLSFIVVSRSTISIKCCVILLVWKHLLFAFVFRSIQHQTVKKAYFIINWRISIEWHWLNRKNDRGRWLWWWWGVSFSWMTSSLTSFLSYELWVLIEFLINEQSFHPFVGSNLPN